MNMIMKAAHFSFHPHCKLTLAVSRAHSEKKRQLMLTGRTYDYIIREQLVVAITFFFAERL